MAKEHVEIEQDGVVGVLLRQRDRHVDGERGHPGATARRVDRGHVAAQRQQLFGR